MEKKHHTIVKCVTEGLYEKPYPSESRLTAITGSIMENNYIFLPR